MTAYLVLMLAALSRLVPHALHGVGLNITAAGGGLLFFGSRRPRWQGALAGMGLMATTDVYLTRVVYEYPFHLQDYLVTWAWYAGVCLLGGALLRRVTVLRVATAVMASATGFFVASNLAVWLEGTLYPHTEAGLARCFRLAVPFYENDLVSTALTSAVLFGLPVVATQCVALWRGAVGGPQRAA